jgi:uncharacterized protein (TIGR02611 family)
VVIKTAKRLIVFVVGITVVLFGVVLLFTPGPGMVVIPAGLAILATEFVWARVLLTRIKRGAADAAQRGFEVLRPSSKASEVKEQKPGAVRTESPAAQLGDRGVEQAP